MIDYRDVLDIAFAYKLTNQLVIFLDDEDIKPWEHVSDIEVGSSIRMEIADSITIIAKIDGLQFKWLFNIEKPKSNGNGFYNIDVDACQELIKNFPPSQRVKLKEYFSRCACLILTKAYQWRECADQQMNDATVLRSLSA